MALKADSFEGRISEIFFSPDNYKAKLVRLAELGPSSQEPEIKKRFLHLTTFNGILKIYSPRTEEKLRSAFFKEFCCEACDASAEERWCCRESEETCIRLFEKEESFVRERLELLKSGSAPITLFEPVSTEYLRTVAARLQGQKIASGEPVDFKGAEKSGAILADSAEELSEKLDSLFSSSPKSVTLINAFSCGFEIIPFEGGSWCYSVEFKPEPRSSFAEKLASGALSVSKENKVIGVEEEREIAALLSEAREKGVAHSLKALAKEEKELASRGFSEMDISSTISEAVETVFRLFAPEQISELEADFSASHPTASKEEHSSFLRDALLNRAREIASGKRRLLDFVDAEMVFCLKERKPMVYDILVLNEWVQQEAPFRAAVCEAPEGVLSLLDEIKCSAKERNLRVNALVEVYPVGFRVWDFSGSSIDERKSEKLGFAASPRLFVETYLKRASSD